MKKIVYLLCILMFFTYSCKETDLTPLEDEIELLKKEINNMQSVIFLQHALSDQKKIVSVASVAIGLDNLWTITFSDNTSVQLPKIIVESIVLDDTTQEYTVKLLDNQRLVFNKKEIIYPIGLVVLTQDIKFLKNTEVSIEFRVNPSNAVFNYDVASSDCQIQFDMTDKLATYSYVTDPERCRLTRIEQSKDASGKIKEGQYTAYIADNGGSTAYKYVTALVLSSKGANGDSIQLSSSGISLERKKDTGLPVVVIHTENKAFILDKENWINAKMTIDGIGKFTDYKGTTSIRGRGNSTWGYPKKPFALKLDSKSEILGMPSHKRWVLLANYMDRTHIRNHIAFEISRRTGLEWTVRGQFVEVVLNETHMGTYYLCEQIKPDKYRVNIDEMRAGDLDEESITGGYILEYDFYFDEVNKFKSKIFNFPVMFKEPDEATLQPEQFEYVQNYIDSLETLLTAPDFVHTRAYASLIADTTFVDWWFVMELTGNHEALKPGSCYFYKDRMDVLKAGPVWDFDWGTFTEEKVTGFYVKDGLYYSQLFKDPVFVNLVKQRWRKFKPLFEEIKDVIVKTGESLATSVELDDAMWSLKNADIINQDETMSFTNAFYKMRGNYSNRLVWLDSQIENLR